MGGKVRKGLQNGLRIFALCTKLGWKAELRWTETEITSRIDDFLAPKWVRGFPADNFFRKVLAEFFENLLLLRKFWSFENSPDKIVKISSKKLLKSCSDSEYFLGSFKWERDFPADDFFGQKSSLLSPRTLRFFHLLSRGGHLFGEDFKTAALNI